MMAKEEPENYFVALHNSKDVRRSILESSRRVIYALQDFHKLVMLRQEKQKLLGTLSAEMKEITLLVSKLNKFFPEDKISKYKEQQKKKTTLTKQTPKITQKKSAKAGKPVKQRSELDELNTMLSSIEAKLERMQ